jgi:integrase
MGLGGLTAVTLPEARKAAAEARKLVHDGIDPIAQRRAARPIPTFGAVADAWIEAQAPGVRSAKSLARWRRALQLPEMDGDERAGRKLVGPSAQVEKARIAALRALRSLPVDAVETADVVRLLKVTWLTKAETSKTARGYIESVLDAAKADGHRTAENPARWRGHLEHLMPKLTKAVVHHRALAYGDVPAFVAELRQREALAALALQFLILTAGRSGEIVGARWGEIDLGARVWKIPRERMKADREHTVPLTDRALAILAQVALLRPEGGGDAIVFPSGKAGLSAEAFTALIKRMGRGADTTVHGFRSAFRDYAGDRTAFSREVAEASLAHRLGDATERAYRRGDALDQRRLLLEAWGNFVEGGDAAGNVVAFAQRP